eukprot:TRINITY_DN25779_c0_g1_i1.p2 TRINITY_DN25779_c0_g1~~TRINITY_DN25779_c0_g1_i1.p2  ORF type:complete len:108 (+),score=25.55 TRINITY_DN25779_c0_g1_i1:87-410(+)
MCIRDSKEARRAWKFEGAARLNPASKEMKLLSDLGYNFAAEREQGLVEPQHTGEGLEDTVLERTRFLPDDHQGSSGEHPDVESVVDSGDDESNVAHLSPTLQPHIEI